MNFLSFHEDPSEMKKSKLKKATEGQWFKRLENLSFYNSHSRRQDAQSKEKNCWKQSLGASAALWEAGVPLIVSISLYVYPQRRQTQAQTTDLSIFPGQP